MNPAHCPTTSKKRPRIAIAAAQRIAMEEHFHLSIRRKSSPTKQARLDRFVLASRNYRFYFAGILALAFVIHGRYDIVKCRPAGNGLVFVVRRGTGADFLISRPAD